MGSRRGYGQFCPVAKAAEIFAERWTPLIVRELMRGSLRFGELQQGIPLVSPTMLSRRLQELEEAGVLERRATSRVNSRDSWEYHLTPAGLELKPLIEALGTWGKRWASTELRREDLDPAFLMWALHRNLRVNTLPADRIVFAFELTDATANKRHWWIIVQPERTVEVCLKHPGYSVDVTVVAKVRALAEILLGHLEPAEAVRSGAVKLEGERGLIRCFRDWCPRSQFAKIKSGI